MSEQKGWFNELYGKGADAIQAIKLAAQKPQEKGKLRRQLEAARDSAKGKIVEAELRLKDLQEPGKFDVNQMLDLERDIAQLYKDIDFIEKHYQEAFGKPMKVLSDED
jgi:hypothetical protein